ncbi:MAG: hypothetical protein ACRCZ0_12000 [Cetobacterium sp.]
MRNILIGLFILGTITYSNCDYASDMAELHESNEQVSRELYRRIARNNWEDLLPLIAKHSYNVKLLIHIMDHEEVPIQDFEGLLSIKNNFDIISNTLLKAKGYR